jgi:hypothetical protein
MIRDTSKAAEPMPGFATCPLASVNLDVRCALYARAKANLFVSNGPCTLAQFMDRPYLMLTQHHEGSEYYAETAAWWRRNGMEPGSGYPWQTQQQREVFSGDTYDEIIGAWDAFSKVL